MATSVGTLRVFLEGNTTHFDRNFGNANRKLSQTGEIARMTGGRIGGLAASMGRLAVPAAFLVGMTMAVRSFADFEDGMTRSLAIMGDVSDSMKGRMSEAAIEMSTITTFSAREAADSYFFLASAGLSAEQSLAAISTVATFGQAGMFDMALATDLLTDAQSALGLTVKNVTQNMKSMNRIGNVLVKANTIANATVQQFSESLTSEAGAAIKAFNIDMEEGVAVLAAYADQGVKGNIAGSMFSRMLRLMQQAVLKNNGAFEKFNIEVFDSTGELNNMADILGDMEKAFSTMSTKERTAALDMLGFKARSQQAILPLIGASEKIRDYQDQLESAGNIMDVVAEKQLDSLSSQTNLLGSNFKALGISVGGTVAKFTGLKGILKVVNANVKSLASPVTFLESVFTSMMTDMDDITAQQNLNAKVRDVEEAKAVRRRQREQAAEAARKKEAQFKTSFVSKTDEEIKAMEKEAEAYQEAFNRFSEVIDKRQFEQASLHDKIGLLLDKRLSVEKQITKAMNVRNWELKTEILQIDDRIEKLKEERRQEMREGRGRSAGALEVGSAAASSAIRQARKGTTMGRDIAKASDETAKNTSETVRLLEELLESGELDEEIEVVEISG